MKNRPYYLYNMFTLEKRDVERLLYDTDEKEGLVKGVMQVSPLSIPLPDDQSDIENVGSLIVFMTTPQGEVVVIDDKEKEVCLHIEEVIRVETTYIQDNIYTMKVFFTASRQKGILITVEEEDVDRNPNED